MTTSISAWKATLAGRCSNRVYRLFRLSGEPPMTRFVAAQMSTSHWYDISAAKRDLGYEPTGGRGGRVEAIGGEFGWRSNVALKKSGSEVCR